MKIKRSRFDIFLEEYTRKFELMNLRHQNAKVSISQRVQEIIRLYIRSGWLSLKDVSRQHSLLLHSISEEISNKQTRDFESLKVWEANRLQELFPELNEP